MLSVQLVGRDRELGAVVRALDDVLDGASRVMAVVGEAGIGKSALLEAVAVSARGRGIPVLERRAAEHEQYVPFSVVDDALVEQLRGERPVVLLLDDMHWADQASLDLVRRLLHRPPGAPYLLVVATRRRGSRALPLLDTARRLPAYEELALEPLDREASLTVLADVSDLAERDRIVDDARGIPLYLREFARTVGQPASTLTCPLLAAAEVELAALPPATRSLVEGAAVAGDPFDPELAAAAAGQEHVGEAVDELVAADIIAARPPGAASRSGTRSCAAPSTTPRRPRGGWPRTSASRRSWSGAAPARRRARITSRSTRGRATRRRWRCSSRRLARRRTGTRRRCAWSPSATAAACWRRPGSRWRARDGCARPSRCWPSSTARSPTWCSSARSSRRRWATPTRRVAGCGRRPRRRRSRSSWQRWTSGPRS